jgi:hypothetical protein
VQTFPQTTGNLDDFIFDPQLYYPQTNRGVLREWSHLPADVHTADRASLPWWEELVNRVVEPTAVSEHAHRVPPRLYPSSIASAICKNPPSVIAMPSSF